MEKIVIRGGRALNGAVSIGGMKNAALPVLFACILVKDKCVIENVPDVRDVAVTLDILSRMGAEVRRINKNSVRVDCTHIKGGTSDYELVRKIRASYYLVGAMLGRFGHARVGLPGGCDFGVRPIDLHIKAFERLGATVEVGGGCIDAKCDGLLSGSNIYFDCCSVGATINAIIAAVQADGVTVLENAAREPHIVDVANFLNACGADIRGAGTNIIKIHGVKELHGCEYTIIPDMIEAGTFMVAAAVTEGKLYINNVIPKHLEAITAKLREMGVTVEEYDEAVLVSREGKLHAVDVKTNPYPGFPTDMNPQMTVLLCLAEGTSRMRETIWNDRFRYVSELQRMGAHISLEDRTAVVRGIPAFTPSYVNAVDLRAGAAVVLAALSAKGRTEITGVDKIERGYDDIVEKLRRVGANIHRG